MTHTFFFFRFTVFLSSVGRIRSWSLGWSSLALTATLGHPLFKDPLQIRLAHCVVCIELCVSDVHLIIHNALDDGIVEVAITMKHDSALVPCLQMEYGNDPYLNILFRETIGRVPARCWFTYLRDINDCRAVVSNVENRDIDLEFINLVDNGCL